MIWRSFLKTEEKRKQMTVIAVSEVVCLDITIEEWGQKIYYRRQNEEAWDRLYGSSWESVSYTTGLENAYQEWMENK